MEADGYTNADLVNLLSEGIELRSLVESATMTNEQIFLPKQRTLELVRSYTDDIKAFILYVCDGPLVKEHITSIQAKIDDEDQAVVKGSKSNSDVASAAMLSGKSSDDLLTTESDTADEEGQASSDDEASEDTVSDDSSEQSIAGLKLADVDNEGENASIDSSLDLKTEVVNTISDAVSKEKQQRQAFAATNPLVSVETDSDDSSVSELEDTVVDDVSDGKEHNFSDNIEDTSNRDQFSDTNTVVEPRQRTYFDILDYADLDESTGIFKLNDNFEKVEVK